MFGKREKKERKKKMKLINLYNLRKDNDSGLLVYGDLFSINTSFISSLEDYGMPDVSTFVFRFSYINLFEKTKDYSKLHEDIRKYVDKRLVQLSCLSLDDIKRTELDFHKTCKEVGIFVRVSTTKITMSNGKEFIASMSKEEIVRLCTESKGNNEIPQLITEYSEKLTPEQCQRMRDLGYLRYGFGGIRED